MIATIAVIAAIAEKKNFSDRNDQSDHMNPLSSDPSDNNRWDIRSVSDGFLCALEACLVNLELP